LALFLDSWHKNITKLQKSNTKTVKKYYKTAQITTKQRKNSRKLY